MSVYKAETKDDAMFERLATARKYRKESRIAQEVGSQRLSDTLRRKAQDIESYVADQVDADLG